jgi:hypothetical protein
LIYKVKLKGMNSYETRLNDLKKLALELDNGEVNRDIENFIVKWLETYRKISKLKCNLLIESSLKMHVLSVYLNTDIFG